MIRLRPKILDLYLASELVMPFLFGVAAFVGLIMGADTLRRLIKFASEYETSPLLLIQWIGYHIPSILVFAFPMAMLLATLWGFGRLSGDGEVTASYAAGLGLFRCARPVLAFALGLSVLSLIFNEVVAVYANQRAQEIKQEILGSLSPGGLSDISWVEKDPRTGRVSMVVYAKEYDRDMQELHDVWLFSFDEEGYVVVTRARAARHAGGATWEGNDVEVEQRFAARPVRWRQQKISIQRTPAEIERGEKDPTTLTTRELKQTIRELGSGTVASLAIRKKFFSLRTELHRRYAVPFSCIVFALTGVPMGIRPQRGSTSVALGISVLVLALYYFLVNYLSVLGDQGRLNPIIAAWGGNILVGAIGLVLIARTPQ